MKATPSMRAALILLVTPIATGALAQSSKPTASAVKTGTGSGTITAVDAKGETVTIKHGPIPAIGWPTMTMTFRASPPTLLRGLRSGQRVAFTAKAKGMTAKITAIGPQ
ncbi:copper-binding protein [Sphingomonas corticis]|jgi:Cu(I)/Ag(I) efflux system protein CusF|uniref:Copper-binding protein n=1 Tax=Sphingomonas corticis TaxID=2722791 RepID=A0ABX1CXQ6_9SPHN|nr:copper-binding protein [Sphingomonas corticis]NJR80792.1 copper-binding protein [Sphingomonas corticis]